MSVPVFLGGEGANELGSHAVERVWQQKEFPGVVEALLRRVQADGWFVIGAIKWSRITKLRAQGPTLRPDQRNVEGLVYDAERAGAAMVAFVRDQDGDPDRSQQIKDGIDSASEKYPTIAIVGGTAIPVLEAWILALKGVRGTESLSKTRAQSKMEEEGVPAKDTAAMVDVVENADLDTLPDDASTLEAWLERAKAILPALVQAAQAGRP